jgi:hypothetical protein
MNNRFPFLSLLSLFLRWIGILIFVCGIFYLGYSIFGDNTEFMTKVISLILLVFGIFVCVIGEIIGVAFAIEDNTKRIADCMSDLKTLVEQSNSLLKQSNTILMQSKSAQKHSFNELA